MEKKIWNKPELEILKSEQTQTTQECSCGADHGILVLSNNVHFCHSLGEWHQNGCKKTEGHYRNEKCSEVHWNGSKQSKCCCAVSASIS